MKCSLHQRSGFPENPKVSLSYYYMDKHLTDKTYGAESDNTAADGTMGWARDTPVKSSLL
jgi:hypothetical protein